MALTDKCPFCGSYNDVEAAVCYFCHKDLPDTPGHKKKRSNKPAEPTSIKLPPSYVVKRKSPPGCLVGLVTFLFLAGAIVVFQALNGMYKFFPWKPTFPPDTDAGRIATILQFDLTSSIDALLKYPIIVLASVVMILILCYGLISLKRWSRVLGLMLMVILLVALLALFVTFVMNFYINPVNNIKFILLLLGIILNIYVVVWLFEHKKLFD